MKIKSVILTSIMGTTALAQGVIDVHSHMIPQEYVAALEQKPG